MPLRDAGAVVGLNAGGIDGGVSPAVGEKLPLVGRVAVGVQLRPLEELTGLERLPCRMVREHIFERGILLEQQRLERGVHLVQFLAARLVGVGEPAGPNIMSTGTGPEARAGSTSVMWILTLMSG